MSVGIEILQRLCRSCDACVPVCPHGALSLRHETLHWEASRCQGCRLCVVICPAEALVPHPRRAADGAAG